MKRKLLTIKLILGLVWAAFAVGDVAMSPIQGNEAAGFLLHLELKGQEVRLTAVTAVERFVSDRHLPGAHDWQVELRDATNTQIWESIVRSPRSFLPVQSTDQVVPFLVRIPSLPRVSTIVLRNHIGCEVLRVPLDEAFLGQARAGREHVQAIEASSERALSAWRAGIAANATSNDATLGLYDRAKTTVPVELLANLTSRLIEDNEAIERNGMGLIDGSNPVAEVPEGMPRHVSDRELAEIRKHLTGLRRQMRSGVFTLSGHVRDATNGTPISDAEIHFIQIDIHGDYVGQLGTLKTDSAGYYSVSVDVGAVQYSLPDHLRYLGTDGYLIIAGDTTADFALKPGVILSGTVRDSSGTRVTNSVVKVEGDGFNWNSSYNSGSSTFTIIVPKNQPITLTVYPGPPYARTIPEIGLLFAVDTIKDLTVERGWQVSGVVRDATMGPIQGAVVKARHINETTTGRFTEISQIPTAGDGTYTFVVPKWLQPGTFVLSVYKAPLLRRIAALSVTSDVVQDFTLVQGITVSGTVRDSGGKPVPYARVRAYHGQEFVASAWTGWGVDGHYQFGIEPGTYTFRVWVDPGNNEDRLSSLAPLEVTDVPVATSMTRDFVLSPGEGVLTLRLYPQNQKDVNLLIGGLRVELRQNNVTTTAGYLWWGVTLFERYDSARSMYYLTTDIYLAPGSYDLRVTGIGIVPIEFQHISVSGAATVSYDLPNLLLWTGTVRSSDGAHLANQRIKSYDELAMRYSDVWSDATGAFKIPIAPGGFVKFLAPDVGRAILYTERFPDPVASRVKDCVLDLFPNFNDTGKTLTQMYGTAGRTNRWNIVFIGDSYTTSRESFTDTNGNGQWDGVVFYDFDQDGLLDANEWWCSIYGSAASPTVGTDPTKGNEPFVDTNGDGFPNDDQATYDRNTLDVIRSLFGQDVWRNHRDLFNVFRIRIASNQAGNDVLRDGVPLISRDTALASSVDIGGRVLLGISFSVIMALVYDLIPEADTIIALVNQPITMGRATGLITLNAGPQMYEAGNNYVVAHELGHQMGGLGDEYLEYLEPYLGPEVNLYPNVTIFSERDQIPWGSLIAADKELPSVPLSSGVGLFEGAYYYSSGVFRPTALCMMVSGDRYCPVCTREIENRIISIAGGGLGSPSPLTPQGQAGSRRPQFTWRPAAGATHHILELRSQADDGLITLMDVYGVAWTPGFDLDSATSYRWRVKSLVEERSGSWSAWFSFSTPALSRPRRHLGRH